MKKRRKKRAIKKTPKVVEAITLPEVPDPPRVYLEHASDDELASECARGSRRAWRVLEERFRGLAFYLCRYWGVGERREEIWQNSLMPRCSL